MDEFKEPIESYKVKTLNLLLSEVFFQKYTSILVPTFKEVAI